MSDRPRFARVWPHTEIHDGDNYVVMATYKDEPEAGSFEKHRGTFDECSAYADRNESPDNNERYYVAEDTGVKA